MRERTEAMMDGFLLLIHNCGFTQAFYIRMELMDAF